MQLFYALSHLCHQIGEEAKSVFEDAQKMLGTIIKEGLLEARGIVGLYPANAVGDDIHVYSEDILPRPPPIAIFHGLRQQVRSSQFI